MQVVGIAVMYYMACGNVTRTIPCGMTGCDLCQAAFHQSAESLEIAATECFLGSICEAAEVGKLCPASCDVPGMHATRDIMTATLGGGI